MTQSVPTPNGTGVTNPLLKALAARYEADKQEAIATLSIYFNNSVGIGEHPQHLEEMDKFVEKLATANDKLENLKKHFNDDGSIA